jgi:hypothetical protein
MAKTKRPPPLSDQASVHKQKLATDHGDRIKAIAEQIAIDSNAENVLVPHLDEAHRTLKRCGLAPPPSAFWKRSDFKVGIGCTATGLSPSICALAYTALASNSDPAKGVIASHPFWFWGSVAALPVMVATAGALVAVMGWMQNHK